jgi:Tol biopolymer transport system component
MSMRRRAAVLLAAALPVSLVAVRASRAADRPIIAYIHANHLSTVSASGGSSTQLTSGNAIDNSPDWDATHTWLAFSHQRGTGGVALYRIRVQDGVTRRLTDGTCTDGSPSWSPNGRRLAFTRQCHLHTQIVILNIRTGRVHRVTTGYDVAWSPTGQWLAVSDSDRRERAAIFLTRPDGSHRHRLTEPRNGRMETPDWSRNGRRLAVSVINSLGRRDLSRSSSDLAVLRRDGTHLRRLTSDHPGVDLSPTWAPGGHRLAFNRLAYDSTGRELYSRILTLTLKSPDPPEVIASEGRHPSW